jgi:large subunit ribosomal protein L9
MASHLKVVFRKDVRGIAQAGEVKNVSPGYARNFLYPRKLAFPATDGALRQWETERQAALSQAAKLRQDAESLARRIEALSCTLAAKASAEGRLFGSVSRQDIQSVLAKEGIALEKRAIILTEPIKQVGTVSLPVHLSGGVQAQLKVTVTPEQ